MDKTGIITLIIAVLMTAGYLYWAGKWIYLALIGEMGWIWALSPIWGMGLLSVIGFVGIHIIGLYAMSQGGKD